MANRAHMSRIAVAAALGVIASTLLSANAQAQGLIDFLWGGGQEWGGGRSIVSFSPQYKPGQIIVSFGDRRLYHVTAPGRATSYPIAVPREQSRWAGSTVVSNKQMNPPWTPTPDMIKENPRLPRWVPGGHPMNPLGNRAMYLGASTYRIHGTDAPWTIGQAVSKGCIRMFNEDVADLYPKVPVGTHVTVTWQKFNANSIADSGAPPASEPRRSYRRTSEGEPGDAAPVGKRSGPSKKAAAAKAAAAAPADTAAISATPATEAAPAAPVANAIAAAPAAAPAATAEAAPAQELKGQAQDAPAPSTAPAQQASSTETPAAAQ